MLPLALPFEIDPGTAKFVVLFGGALIWAVYSLWSNVRALRAIERAKAEAEAEKIKRSGAG